MIYLVLSAVCLALLYGVYRLALSRTTLHRFNRIMLLSIIGLSAILPSFKIKGIHFDFKKNQTVLVEKDNTPLEAQTEVVPIISEPIDYVLITQEEPKADAKTSVATGVKVAETVTQMDWVTIVTYLYLMGAAFFMIRLLIGIIRVETLCHLGGRKLSDGSVLLVCDGQFQPTSWRHTIIISRSDYESDNSRMIIEHEQAHIHHRHSIDVLLAQMVCALQWFNPAAWALKRSLQEVHEYEADAAVLADGLNERQYQLCLVQAALSGRIGYVTSNFADCSTKKRITMMKRSQSSPFACFRALLLLPAVAVLILMSSACKSDTAQGKSDAAQSEPAVESTPAQSPQPTAQSVTQKEPFDADAFLKKYPLPELVRMNDLMVTVERSGEIWINADIYRACSKTSLPTFEKDLEQFKKDAEEANVKIPEQDRVFVTFESRDNLEVCSKLTDMLSKTYAQDKIHLLESRRVPILAMAPRWGFNMNTEKDKCLEIKISADNIITLTAWNAPGNPKKVEKKIADVEDVKGEIDNLFSAGSGKVKYGLSADQKSTGRISARIMAFLREDRFVQADYNKGPANMTHKDSIDYIILGKDGGDSGRKRHVKDMKWYNDNKDKEEFFRMGFIDGQLCVCKGNDPSKLAPLAFDDLVPYFKANCPDGNERSAIVLLELPMDDESVPVEFLDKLLTKMEGWVTTFTRRLYVSPKHIE